MPWLTLPKLERWGLSLLRPLLAPLVYMETNSADGDERNVEKEREQRLPPTVVD